MYTTSLASGKDAIYLDNIDVLSGAELMPGAEFVANAVISCIFGASETKTIKRSGNNQPGWELAINKRVRDYVIWAVSSKLFITAKTSH